MADPKGKLYTIIAFDPDGNPVALRMNASGELMTVVSGGAGEGTPAVAQGRLITPVVFDPNGKLVGMETDEYGQLKVVVSGAVGHEYVFRGDPDAADYDQDDFEIDQSYHDLDLSAIVTDASAVAVHFRFLIKDALEGKGFYIRKNGQTYDKNSCLVATIHADKWNYMDAWCACDENQVIEYSISNGTDAVQLTVRGWLK